jgi:hypothetical protein
VGAETHVHALQHVWVVLDDENLFSHCAQSSVALSAWKMHIVSGDLTQKRVHASLPGTPSRLRPFSGKSRISLHFPLQSGSKNALHWLGFYKEVPMKQPEQATWAVTQSAIVHAGSATPHGLALFLAALNGRTGAGGDPHANIPSASSLPLSFFRRWDGASMGLASDRRTGLGSRATNPDPDGNQLEQNPLFLVPSPAG